MNTSIITKELLFKAVRSSGAGGQNVNKVATKILLAFHIKNSNGLTDEEKNRLQEKLHSKITTDGWLKLSCGQTRSQLKNKELVIKRLFKILAIGLQKSKQRKTTTIPKRIKENRLKNKKNLSQLKKLRQKPIF